MSVPAQPPAQTKPKRFPWLVAGRRRPRWLPGIPLRLRRSVLWRYLAVLGPGLIAAASGNDAGGIATYASVGAQYGYSLLWALALITVSLGVVQEMSARLGAVTGKGFSDLIRERFDLRWTAFALFSLLVANAGTTISEFAGIGAALELFGISRYISVPAMAAAMWWLVVKGSYRRMERISLVMTLGFFAYVASAFLAKPDWGEVARNTVIPALKFDAAYLFMLMALVGTTITPFMQLYQQSTLVEKGVTANEYPLERLDVISGVIFSNLISFFIIVATAATLFAQGIHVETAADAAKALQPLAGPFASALFAAGLFGTSMLAAGVVPLATAFSICEAFGLESGINKELREAPVFFGLFTGLLVLGVAVTLIPGLPLIQLLVVVQVVNGILLPIELVFITLMASDRELMGKHAHGRLFNILAWATTVVISLLALTLVVATVILPIFGVRVG